MGNQNSIQSAACLSSAPRCDIDCAGVDPRLERLNQARYAKLHYLHVKCMGIRKNHDLFLAEVDRAFTQYGQSSSSGRGRGPRTGTNTSPSSSRAGSSTLVATSSGATSGIWARSMDVVTAAKTVWTSAQTDVSPNDALNYERRKSQDADVRPVRIDQSEEFLEVEDVRKITQKYIDRYACVDSVEEITE